MTTDVQADAFPIAANSFHVVSSSSDTDLTEGQKGYSGFKKRKRHNPALDPTSELLRLVNLQDLSSIPWMKEDPLGLPTHPNNVQVTAPVQSPRPDPVMTTYSRTTGFPRWCRRPGVLVTPAVRLHNATRHFRRRASRRRFLGPIAATARNDDHPRASLCQHRGLRPVIATSDKVLRRAGR